MGHLFRQADIQRPGEDDEQRELEFCKQETPHAFRGWNLRSLEFNYWIADWSHWRRRWHRAMQNIRDCDSGPCRDSQLEGDSRNLGCDGSASDFDHLPGSKHIRHIGYREEFRSSRQLDFR